VNFGIQPGGKTRIRNIEFEGNTLFTDQRLRDSLKITEPRRWYWPWTPKNLYHPLKWDQDATNVSQVYLDAGYLDVEIKPPIVELVKGSETAAEPAGGMAPVAEPAARVPPDGLTPAELERWNAKEQRRLDNERKKAEKQASQEGADNAQLVDLRVRITEGQQYRVGEVAIEGNEVIGDDMLLRMLPLKGGMVLSNGALESGIRGMTRAYEDRGHLYATVVRGIRRRPDEAVADIRIDITEDRPYFVEKIEFTGNTSTEDRVLRRELLLYEGDLFSRTKLDVSKQKVNQLGYFEVVDDPVVEPIEGENRVRIRFQGEERGRNEVQVGGGYSGLDGAFFSGVYSTRNFLGKGQIVSLAVQVGGSASRYQVSFQEPWFMNRPITLGFSLYRRDADYGSTLTSSSTGIGIIGGRRVGTFSTFRLGYGYENVTSRAIGFALNDQGDFVATDTTSEYNISSITPSYIFDRINNPYRPTAGQQFTATMQIAGHFLGGDTSFLKPLITYTRYDRIRRMRPYLAFHGEIGLIRSWGEGTTVPTLGALNGVPRYQRFFLGGDTQGPRVFETRRITPLRYVRVDVDGRVVEVIGDPEGIPVSELTTSNGVPVLIEVGGDRFFLFQTEVVYPINQQAEVAVFLDAGDSLFEDQSWGWDTARVSAGLELRFYLPVFPVPLRLIYGWPIRSYESDGTSSFTFSIGRSF